MRSPGRRLTPLLAVACALLTTHARADDADARVIDQLAEEALKAFRVPGAAIAVVKGDKVVHVRGYGVRELGKDDPVTADTVFAIASCTKAFTATAVAMLVDEGKLAWDDPVRKHLEFFRLEDAAADRGVTLRDLLSHRSGMPRHDMFWAGTSGAAEDVIRRYGRARPSTPFRSTWEYANVPFTTAGLIAGRAGGSDWAGVTRKRLLEPLGMRGASCTAKEAEAAPDHSSPHTRLPGGETRPVAWADIDNAGGAGCINASARDMANWLRFQLADGAFDGKRLVAATALRETRAPQMVVRQEGRWKVFFPEKATSLLTYGLGWFVHDHRGRLAVSHGGTLDGFRAQTLLAPKDGCGVVVFGNLAPSHFVEALSKSLLDHLLGLPKEDWNAFYRQEEDKQEAEYADRVKKRADDRKKDTKPSRELSAYAGGYEESAYGRAEVKRDGNALALTWGRLTFRLEHYHYDTFTATVTAPADDKVRYARAQFDALFRLGTDGEVEGLRFLDQEFRRAKSADGPFDVIVRGGTVYDGTGAAGRRADVGIRDDKIVAVGDLSKAAARQVIDAKGLAVTPGFINMLSWSNESLLADGRSQSEIRQGVTTQVMGEGDSMGPLNDRMKKRWKSLQTDIQYDIGWTSLADYLRWLERVKVSTNVASFLGATTVREHVIGLGDRKPTPAELDQMRALVEESMKDGALGIASALEYAPAYYADTEELIELCKVAARYQGKYISHMRSEGPRLLEGLDEVIRIAREAKVPAEVYHFKAAGKANWPKLDAAVAKIEAARREGLKITADVYCYTAGCTGLDACIPPWAQDGGPEIMRRRLRDPDARKRIALDLAKDDWPNFYKNAGSPANILPVGFKKEALKPLQGKTLAEIAKQRGKEPVEALMDLLAEDESRITTVYFIMSEENVRKLIPLPWVSFCSDEASQAPEGVFLKAMPHPRAYGSFARLLGKYVRDEKLLPLEAAVHKLSGLPAANLGLDRRGLLREGYFADVVVFDPQAVADKATYEKPHQYAVGVRHVLVNGVAVLKDGEHTGAKPGRALWGPGKTRD